MTAGQLLKQQCISFILIIFINDTGYNYDITCGKAFKFKEALVHFATYFTDRWQNNLPDLTSFSNPLHT